MDLRSGRSLTTKQVSKSNPKEPSTDSDHNARFCNRIGCNGRIRNGSQNVKIGRSNKAMCSKPSLNSPSGNEGLAISRASNSLVTKSRRSNLGDRRESSSKLALDPSVAHKHSSSPSWSSSQNLSTSMNKTREAAMAENRSSSAPSNVTFGKRSLDKLGSNRHNPQPTPLVTSTSKSSGMGTLDRSNRTTYFLRNLKCKSISDFVPGIYSSTKSVSSTRKRSQEAERGSDRRVRRSSNAASVQNNVSTLKKKVSSKNNSSATSSVRTSKGTILNHGRSSSSSRVLDSSIADSQSTTVLSLPGRPRLLPRNIDAQQTTNVDSVAELLLAVEMMKQDMQLTQELSVLDNSLLLSGLDLYDQYWEMRMDIDDMSYEELLDLGEQIGTVSTALSEEQLHKFIEIDKYQKTSSKVTGGREEADEMRCCICQEGYVFGDEIGRLAGCRHEYHATCINQWMMLKNWCPICRSTAAQPPSA